MKLMLLADLLEESGIGTKGKDIFVNMMPPEAMNAVLLKNRLTGVKIDHELPGYYQSKFAVVIRGSDYSLEEEGGLIDQVMAALTFSATALDGVYVNYIRPMYHPVVFPLSAGSILEWNVEFEACYVTSK